MNLISLTLNNKDNNIIFAEHNNPQIAAEFDVDFYEVNLKRKSITIHSFSTQELITLKGKKAKNQLNFILKNSDKNNSLQGLIKSSF